jgi:hypothetical protein
MDQAGIVAMQDRFLDDMEAILAETASTGRKRIVMLSGGSDRRFTKGFHTCGLCSWSASRGGDRFVEPASLREDHEMLNHLGEKRRL